MVKTLFLSNADLKETIDLLRIVLGARRVAPLPGANALTINDTPDKVAAAERIVAIVEPPEGGEPEERAVIEFVRGVLAGYKAPRHVLTVESVGRAPNGKVDYKGLRRQAIDRLA